jgi:hypothetical protein
MPARLKGILTILSSVYTMGWNRVKNTGNGKQF